MDVAAISKALGKAYEDYFALSDILRADMGEALKHDFASEPARRNFIRVSWSWIEGYSESLRRITVTIQPHTDVVLTAAQRRLIEDERLLGACDRTKETLKLAYAVFGLDDAPRFDGMQWQDVQIAGGCRDKISHPKTADDLRIPDDLWARCCAGTVWVMEQLIVFHTKMLEQSRNDS